jgi:hypothetical protein
MFMTQKKRSRISPAEKTDIWKRWKAGQTLHEIERSYVRQLDTWLFSSGMLGIGGEVFSS